MTALEETDFPDLVGEALDLLSTFKQTHVVAEAWKTDVLPYDPDAALIMVVGKLSDLGEKMPKDIWLRVSSAFKDPESYGYFDSYMDLLEKVRPYQEA